MVSASTQLTRLALAIALVPLGAACSDDTSTRDAALPIPDRTAIDLAPATPRPIGGPCKQDSDCEHKRCLLQRGGGVFPDGYCSKPCDSIANPCSSGASCAGTVDGDCFKICAAPADCRKGYTCVEGPGGGPPKICFPGS